MCTADLEPVPWIWVGRDGFRLPEFSREHKCYNYEAVRSFAEKNQVPQYVDDVDFGPPADAVVYEKDFFTR